MAKFAVDTPIVTVEPGIVVDAGLPAGAHRFQLEVVTRSGQRSLPDIAVVQVDDGSITLTPVDPRLAVLSPAVATTAPNTALPAAPRTVTTRTAAPRTTRKKKG